MQWDRHEGNLNFRGVFDVMRRAKIKVSRKQRRGIMKSRASLRQVELVPQLVSTRILVPLYRARSLRKRRTEQR